MVSNLFFDPDLLLQIFNISNNFKHSRQPRLLFEKRESPVRFQSNVKRGGVVGDGVVGDGVVGDGVVGNGVVFWAK